MIYHASYKSKMCYFMNNFCIFNTCFLSINFERIPLTFRIAAISMTNNYNNN